MKHEYREGEEARKTFDEGMQKLFRAPKKVVKAETAKTDPKPKKASKD
jgi:hypothetical protein